jgi:hypothetical protein
VKGITLVTAYQDLIPEVNKPLQKKRRSTIKYCTLFLWYICLKLFSNIYLFSVSFNKNWIELRPPCHFFLRHCRFEKNIAKALILTTVSVARMSVISTILHEMLLGYKLTLGKGDGTSVAVLHLYDSFHQKCSKLGTYTTQGLKNKGREWKFK